MAIENDINWLAGFTTGDAAAFSSLYKLLYRRLNYFVFTMVEDTALAEDIATDCFVKLWHKRETFESFQGIKAYLYLVARNAGIDHLRAEKRHTLSHRELLYLQSDSEQRTDYRVADAEIMAALYQQVQALPPKCAEVFKLIYLQGMSTAEVAAVLQISTKTVLNQKLKAIGLLKAELLKKGLLPLLLLIKSLE